MIKVLIRQTPMGAYAWYLMDTRTSNTLAQSCDYPTRDEALKAANDMATIWPQAHGNLIDQTPDAKREAANGKT